MRSGSMRSGSCGGVFETIRSNVKESIGQYLSGLMETELAGSMGRERYEQVKGERNHGKGSYGLR